MAGRYFGPARIVLEGDRVKAKRHIGQARKLMGILLDRMKASRTENLSWRRSLPDGSTIVVAAYGRNKSIFITTQKIVRDERLTFKGIVCRPRSTLAQDGWGFPYTDLLGEPIDTPRGTLGGDHPEGIIELSSDGSTVSFIRSSQWFSEFGDRPMSSIAGGAEWQSNIDSTVISYGALGASRYERRYIVAKIFKDSFEIVLDPLPTGLIAVAADAVQHILYVAISELDSYEFRVFAYFMEDETLLIQDVAQPAQEIFFYDLLGLADEDDTSLPDLVKRDDINIAACNFSANADKCVFTTSYGDLLEMSVSGTTVNITDTHKVRRGIDDGWFEADFTGTSTPRADIWTVLGSEVEFFPLGCINPGSGNPDCPLPVQDFPLVDCWIERCHIRRVAGADSSGSMVMKGHGTFYLFSDYDRESGERVDLKYVYSGSRSFTEAVENTFEYKIPHLTQCAFEEADCTEDFGRTPGDISSGTFVLNDTIVIGSGTGHTGSLILGNTVLETTSYTSTTSEIFSQNHGGFIIARDNNYFVNFGEFAFDIFALDLTNGFIAYRTLEPTIEKHDTLNQTDPGDAFDVPIKLKVVGGRFLSSVTHNANSRDISANGQLIFWGFYDSTLFGLSLLNTNNIGGFSNFREMIRISGADTWENFDTKFPINYLPFNKKQPTLLAGEFDFGRSITSDGGGDVVFSNRTKFYKPNMMLADVSFIRDSESTGEPEFRYVDFTHGDPVVLVSAVGGDESVVPLGVI